MKRRDPKTTPRPWRWLPNKGQFIVGPDYQIIAEVPCQGCNPADGELIVTAVNERDQLLQENEKLKAALKPFAELSQEIAGNRITPRDNYLSVTEVFSDGSSWNYASISLADLKVAEATLNPISAAEENQL